MLRRAVIALVALAVAALVGWLVLPQPAPVTRAPGPPPSAPASAPARAEVVRPAPVSPRGGAAADHEAAATAPADDPAARPGAPVDDGAAADAARAERRRAQQEARVARKQALERRRAEAEERLGPLREQNGGPPAPLVPPPEGAESR